MFFKMKSIQAANNTGITRYEYINKMIASNNIIQHNIMNQLALKHYVEDRIKFYLGDIYHYTQVRPVNDYINVDVLLNNMDETKKKYPKGIFEHGIYSSLICKLTHRGLLYLDTYVNGYTKRLLTILEAYKVESKYMLYLIGDVEKKNNDYYFSKIRLQDCEKCVLLKSANTTRHWGFLYQPDFFKDDIPFENKKSVAVWRGATTGQINRTANRFDLVEKYFHNNNKIDIGFSNIAWGTVDVSGNYINYHSFEKYLKGKMTESQQLQYKYLLSVDGNDKSTGLNWQLASNSLVFMAKPLKISWLMENKLIANVHYIELLDDFSDLEEKIEWCENHPNECATIVKNAKQFMSQFYNEDLENYIEAQVILRYLQKIDFSKITFM